MWAKTKTTSKTGFDKLYGWVDKLGPPVNRLSNKLGSEAFWPTTLDKESDKAARILKSFCKDGFYQEEETPSPEGPKTKQKVLKKIPTEVIKNAKGLAIFTTMRTGLWFSGAGGSGILIGRTEDGAWSPPSGIMLHTAGLGFLAGVDIYDCVVVINTQQALDAFSKIRCTLGGEVSAVAGPVGMGGVLETEVHKRAPVFTYMKSRGLYAGVQVDGTIIIERSDENERFYGERIGVGDILRGKARHPPYEIRRLLETIKAAQGDSDFDESMLPSEPPPADYEIEAPTDTTFGVPDKEDPDPYGVLALQEAGLEIKEAGTHKRPTSEQFEFNPSPTSPIYSSFRRSFDRSSIDGRSVSRRSSWRTSTISSVLEPRTSSKMVDMSTQTDMDAPTPIQVPPPLPPRQNHTPSPTLADIPETKVIEDIPNNTTEVAPIRKSEENGESHIDLTTESKSRQSQAFDNIDLDDEASDEEEPIIEEIHQAAAPQPIIRARIVQVAKPIAPKLPPRNPFRNRGSYQSTTSNDESTRDGLTDPSPVTGQSPPATPSLKDGSSASSIDDFERLEHATKELQPHVSHETKEEKEDFHSLPESPTKAIPGGFH